MASSTSEDQLATTSEAPFPESLIEPLLLAFCPAGGTILDPFCGSGTTAAVAKRNNRNSISMDIRPSQTNLATKRLAL